MPETTEAVIGNSGKAVEAVDELPQEAIKDKIIFNKSDKSFYLGVGDKEEN